MLKYLHIKHFTIITEHELEFDGGLTVLTGETGAGKSILLDALGIVLGERAESTLIQVNQERCEVTAIFDITQVGAAQAWLLEQELDDGPECIVRRVINRDGRSRNTINGRPCAVQQVRQLASLLVHIHGQNQHSLLVKADHQRELLDNFAQHEALRQAVRQCYGQWKNLQDELQANQMHGDHQAQLDLLHFQLQEFEQLGLQPNEWSELVREQQRLAHAEQWQLSCQQVINLLIEDEQQAVLTGLHNAGQLLKHFAHADGKLATAEGLLEQAGIQIKEAGALVRQTLNNMEPDPERLSAVDQRLASIQDLARKHRVEPEELLAKHHSLQQQLLQLTTQDERMAQLMVQMTKVKKEYAQAAYQLSASRKQAAQQLSELVTQQMHILGMPHGQFAIKTTLKEGLYAEGQDGVEFLVSQGGQPLMLLAKVASGGELSRISLAIQVITATTAQSPTLIFDEVDAGIGGRTAEIVGQQLRQLGGKAQVLCVTHLPQVAAQAHQHLLVHKQESKNKVTTAIEVLGAQEKIAEIARMLGGVTITKKTLAHAKEMLKLS